MKQCRQANADKKAWNSSKNLCKILEKNMPVSTLLKRYNMLKAKVVAFDRSFFKIFALRFSKESVETPSCQRPKTAQRTLFLPVEVNNCFPINGIVEAYEWGNLPTRSQFKHRFWFLADTPVIALFAKIMMIADSFHLSNLREDVHWTISLFQLSVWFEKGIAAWYCLFGNKYWFQMTETGFAK